MTTKILRRTTIIPSDLYIERAADRQLKSIVDDMGRPGYVLVARQMGKTNLLIHMKRTRQDDLVLYKDLSTQFRTSSAFFRDIIDSLLESFPELQSVSEQIAATRNADTESNIEYDRHLRLILKSTSKKIVIVLDEIDSLVNAPFSDVVFAQIRSMYFSRINFSEFERLTYVLSGVAEPTDLIKNKNISPFNIGEKIYLEDFDRSEFDSFIKKSKLKLQQDTIEEIYSWTKGNPRTTWDLCSELEDLALSGEELNEKVVSGVVHKLYLKDFDRAPIDHIRILVEADKVIRDAIVSIRWGKADYLDDKTKSRLYLSGITRSAGGTAVIKNRIIDVALSDSWISSITSIQTSPVVLARSYYALTDYVNVIALYEEFKLDSEIMTAVTTADRLEYATSYLWQKMKQPALAEFEECINLTASEVNRQGIELRIGNILFYFGEYLDAVSYFLRASEGPSTLHKYNSQLNIADAYQSAGIGTDIETVRIVDELLTELGTPENLTSDHARSIYVAALVCRARSSINMKNFMEADLSIQQAFPMANYNVQPKLLLIRYDAAENDAQKQKLLLDASNIIISRKLKTSYLEGSDLIFNHRQMFFIFEHLLEHNLTDDFEELLKYASEEFYHGELSNAELVLLLFNSIPSNDEKSKALKALTYCAENFLDTNTIFTVTLKVYRELSTYSQNPQATLWRIKYLEEIEKHTSLEHLVIDDVKALFMTAYHLRRQKNIDTFDRLFRFLDGILLRSIEISPYWTTFALAQAMLGMRDRKEIASSKIYAEKIISLIDDNEKFFLSGSSSEDFISLKNQANDLLRVRIDHDPFRHIGRNQIIKIQYGTDQIQSAKFKQVREDLISGKCILLSDA